MPNPVQPAEVGAALTRTVAPAVATVSAGAFGCRAVLGLREGMAAVVGQGRFRRIAAGVQAALVVTLMTTLLLLPGASADGTARARLRRGSVMGKALPPLWFVGLHETLAGSVLDSLPRSLPPRYLVAADRDATELYRSLRPHYHELAWLAMPAPASAGVRTTVARVWNRRRRPGSPQARIGPLQAAESRRPYRNSAPAG